MHGHILCVMLGIPHVLLPAPYTKLEAIRNTWTRDVSFCRWVAHASEIPAAVAALLAGERAG